MINMIKNKYNRLSVEAKTSIWFVVCGVFQRGISTITTPIFSRLLSTSEYGVYSVFSSWLELLTVIVTLKLGVGAYMRGMIKFENDQKRFTTSFLGLTSFMTLFWLFIYLLLNRYINQFTGLTTFMMLCMFIMMWAASVYEIWSAEQRVLLKYKKLVFIILLTSVAKPILSIILILLTVNYKAEARILGLTIVEFVSFAPLFMSMANGKKNFHVKEYWNYGMKYNLPLVPHYLSSLLLAHSDRIMINTMIGATAAGKYSLVYNIAGVMQIFNTAINNTLTPWTYKNIKTGNLKKIGNISSSILLVVALINLLMIACAPEILCIFAPESYRDALDCIYPVTMSILFMFLYNVFSKFAMYFEKTSSIMTISLVCAGINIILNYIFILKYGYIAAAYTTLFCYFIYAVGHYLVMHSICKKIK